MEAALEEHVVEDTPKLIEAIGKLGFDPPIFLLLTLVGVRDLIFGLDTWAARAREQSRINRDVLPLPEIFLESLDGPLSPHLKATLDAAWNAIGIDESPFFDKSGNWIGNR